MKVIENIKEIRLSKGIPQKNLADALDVDVAVISNIENGKRELKVSELEKISNCLDVDIIDLFTYPVKYAPKGEVDDSLDAVLQVKLKGNTKLEVLRIVFGDQNLELLND